MSKNIHTTLLEAEVLNYFKILLNYVIQIPKRKRYKGFQTCCKKLLACLSAYFNHTSSFSSWQVHDFKNIYNKTNITVKTSAQ